MSTAPKLTPVIGVYGERLRIGDGGCGGKRCRAKVEELPADRKRIGS